MTSVSQDYTGRIVDLCVLETPAYPGPAPVLAGISGSGSVVSGPYKVVQKFVKFLFTEKGSVPSDPDYGTLLAVKLFGGHIGTPLGLQVEFYVAMPTAVNYVAGTIASPADSESLTDVKLDSIDVSQDKVSLRMRFTFKDSSVILAPVAISTV